MALVDELTLHIKAGKGGDGVVRWIHEKFREFGGPGGGDGGRGGSVYVQGVRDSWLLARYRNTKEFVGPDGEQGGNHRMKGADGEELVIDLPVGSVIRNLATDEVFRLDEEGQKIMLAKGGNGGLGNDHFKGSTNQRPKQHTDGKPGEEADFYIEVELIAEAGFIGLPNAGKSSLLNALTRADVKVGNYEFTTLEPNLGDLYGHILADIPGLIEGAAEGKGLGHKFLRHIKRTKLLVHCVSCEHFLSEGIEGVLSAYKTIRRELEQYEQSLAEKSEMILFTKTDVLTPEQLAELKKFVAKTPVFATAAEKGALHYISVLDDAIMSKFSKDLIRYIS
jgi:GTP-binding protein